MAAMAHRQICGHVVQVPTNVEKMKAIVTLTRIVLEIWNVELTTVLEQIFKTPVLTAVTNKYEM